jgi:hypothetical protein
MKNRELDSAPAPATDRHRLYLHAKYHPRGIPRRMVHQIYNRACVKTKIFDNFIVAYHRPKNLRDLLSKTKLQSSPAGPKASKLVSLKILPLPQPPLRARTNAWSNPSAQRATQLRSMLTRVYVVSI